jgi:hypothetical protein
MVEESMKKRLECLVFAAALLAGCSSSNPSGPAGKPGYTLTVEVVDALGGVTVSPEKQFYSVQDTVTLTVVAKGSYVFRGWSGDITDTARTVRVVMNGDKTVSADFQRRINGPKLLAISVQAANGTVDFGLSQVVVDSAAGMLVCDSGALVMLLAKPDSGFQFVQWSGDTVLNTPLLAMTIAHNTGLSVLFAQLSSTSAFDTVSIRVPVAAGRVAIKPVASGKFSMGGLDTSFIFPHNERLTLIAHPYIDCKFVSWAGDISGTNDTMTLDVSSNRSVTATFKKDSSSGPAFVGYWKVGGWSFISSMGGPFVYTSGGDTCFLDIRADHTYSGWSIEYYNVVKSSGTWTADNSYIYFSSSGGWDEQVIWQVSKGQTSASLSLIVAGESGQIHEMCSR